MGRACRTGVSVATGARRPRENKVVRPHILLPRVNSRILSGLLDRLVMRSRRQYSRPLFKGRVYLARQATSCERALPEIARTVFIPFDLLALFRGIEAVAIHSATSEQLGVAGDFRSRPTVNPPDSAVIA